MRLFHVDPSQLRRFDFVLAILVLGLSLCGVLLIWGSGGQEWAESTNARKQLVWLSLGAVVFLLCCFLEIRTLEWASWPLYVLCLLLLVGLFVKGYLSQGALAWYKIGPTIRIQPSEIAKIATVLALAAYLSRGRTEKLDFGGLFTSALIAGAPAALTIMQNDLGTAVMFFPLFLAMVFMAGVRKRVLVGVLAVLLVAAAAALPRVKDYHVERVAQVLGPRLSRPLIVALDRDPAKIWDRAGAYSELHMLQARVTLGSGQLKGKGWGRGTQTPLRWLYAHDTDFIYASMGEQFGFMGCAALVFLYAVMVWRGSVIALDARDMFCSLMVVGLLTVFVVHAIVNLGVALGLLPVIGVPLPFLSYGGSFLLTQFAVFGLIVNVGMRQFLY
jgi:rod shape determining protein RodA